MTPGAAAAFERTGEQPLSYVRRHVQGDWGELDAHDIQENEFSLQRGLRLLSRYTLRDGTVIWIITEADRSATTLRRCWSRWKRRTTFRMRYKVNN